MECVETKVQIGTLTAPASTLSSRRIGAYGQCKWVFPPTGQSRGQLEAALDNLALVASTDLAILQQLTAANLALTMTNAILTATNKALIDLATKARAAANAGGTGGTAACTGKGREKNKTNHKRLLLDAWT